MTDGLNMQKCPKCGKDNLAHMTHCVHCGTPMEDLFHFDGQIETPEDSNEEPIAALPFIFDEMQSAPQSDDDSSSTEPSPEKKSTDEDGSQSPDWLERVRERVRAEDDASGLLTKGLSALQERLESDEKGDAESQYQAWLDEIREKAEREKAKQAERLQPSPLDEQGVPEWLRRIRALHPDADEGVEELKTEDEWTEEELEELRRRELGDDYVPNHMNEQTAEDDTDEPEEDDFEPDIEHNIPEDYEDLTTAEAQSRKSKVSPAPIDEALDNSPEETGFVMMGEPKLDPDEVFDTKAVEALLAQSDQSPPARKKASRDAEKEAILQDLVILRGQHEKVALLKALISEEGRPLPSSGEIKTKKRNHSRLIIGLAFILVLLFSIIFIPKNMSHKTPISVPQERFTLHLDAMDANKSLLLVMSYSAASATELEALTAPVIQALEDKGLSWQAMTLRMDGLWLAESLFEKADLKNPPAPVFLPGGQYAMLNLAIKPDDQTELEEQKVLKEGIPKLDDFDYVLLVTDSSLSVRGWLEQVAVNQPSINTFAIISQKEAVAIQPYFDSGQILAYLSGMQGLVGAKTYAGIHQSVFHVGLILMILLLILGFLLRPESDEQPKPEAGGQA